MNRTKCFFLFFLISMAAQNLFAANHMAKTCSFNDVSSAVNSASDGDTVLIPDGSCTWDSGITTTKQIIIRAENYTPTPAGTEGSGATSRNVVLTNNISSGAMFSFTSGDTYHCGVGGIQFNEGTGDASFISLEGSGSKPPKIFDCYFHNISVRGWPAGRGIDIQSLGAIMWNTVMIGTVTGSVGEGAILVRSPNRVWETDSTKGMDDTNGNINVYFEDSTFKNLGIIPDIDDHGRFVARHCINDGAWGETHGFSSTWGGRHWEFYDNTFQVTTTAKTLANRYFWARAGTGIFTDNEVNNANDTQSYGSVSQLDVGDNYGPSSGYPQERQPGWGYENGSHVIDPIYMWNQTGDRAYTYSIDGAWSSHVQLNRDIYVNNGAKPGYTKYTYPHPLRSGSDVTLLTPNPPANLRLVDD